MAYCRQLKKDTSMNFLDYMKKDIMELMGTVEEDRVVKPDSISRTKDAYSRHLSRVGLDIETSEKYEDAKSSYLAASLAADCKETAKMFRENEDLKEISIDYYIGKNERMSALSSRETVNELGETVRNSFIIDHAQDNEHLEGILRLSTAYINSLDEQ